MPEIQQTPRHHELSARSRLLSAFFGHLNAEGVAYAVMNNYEELPWIIPSDVDFTIPAELFARLDAFMLDFAGSQEAFVVQKLWHGNQKCAYILCVGAERQREFIQLDFFVAFSTKGCPRLLSHEELIAGRRQLRNFLIPHPQVELLFTAMRRLFKDDWSDRHCTRIAQLRGRIVGDDSLPPNYTWLQPTLDAAVRGELATVQARRTGDWNELRRSARNNMGIRERLANAALQTKRIAVRLRDETGHLVVVEGPSTALGDWELHALEIVFHRQLYLADSKLAARGTWARMILSARLALLKRRKALVFLKVLPNQGLSSKLAQWLRSLGLVDQQLEIAPAPASGTLNVGTTAVSSAGEVIEAIIARQAEKTRRAIMRGWTQTSG